MQAYRAYHQQLRTTIIVALLAMVAVPAFAVSVTVKNEGTADAVLRKWNGTAWAVEFTVASGETRKYTASSGDWIGLFHPTTGAELQKLQVSPPPSRNELKIAGIPSPPPPPTPPPIPTPAPPSSSKIELVAVNNSTQALVLQLYKTGGWVTVDPYVAKTTGDIRKQVDPGSYWRFATRATPAVQVKRLQVSNSARLLEVSQTDLSASPGPAPPPPGPTPPPAGGGVEVNFLNTSGHTIKLVQVLGPGPGGSGHVHQEVFSLKNRYQQKMKAIPGDHYEIVLASNDALMGTYLIPSKSTSYSINASMLPKTQSTRPIVITPAPAPTTSGPSGPREMMRRLLGR